MKAFFTAKRRYHKPPLRGGQAGALTRTPTLRRRRSVGLIASTVTSDELQRDGPWPNDHWQLDRQMPPTSAEPHG